MPGYWATVAVATAWVPDYVSLNINVGIVGGGTIAINLDRNGHPYVGPGLNVGKSATFVSARLTANWLNQLDRPSESQLNSFLTRNSFNFTAGYWGGVQVGWTPGSGTSSGAGFVSPQVGLARTYSWKLFQCRRKVVTVIGKHSCCFRSSCRVPFPSSYRCTVPFVAREYSVLCPRSLTQVESIPGVDENWPVRLVTPDHRRSGTRRFLACCSGRSKNCTLEQVDSLFKV